MSVIVTLVAENTSRVISVQDVSRSMIENQMDAIFEDIDVHGVKVGMLSNVGIMKTVAGKLKEYHPKIIVVDPVMTAKDGCVLMEPEALQTLIGEIIPLTYLLTPNVPEAETIIGCRIKNHEEMKYAAKEIHLMGAKNVLIKGGHLEGDPVDLLYNGSEFRTYSHPRIHTKNTHGTGCTLSSAITANLAKGETIEEAVKLAKEYVTNAIKYSLSIGRGNGPTNHFYNYNIECEEK
jgi:hydroxymethylpyrimidine/phosphomethylpyrimidine kinase